MKRYKHRDGFEGDIEYVEVNEEGLVWAVNSAGTRTRLEYMNHMAFDYEGRGWWVPIPIIPTLTGFMKDEFSQQEVFDYILMKMREQQKPSIVIPENSVTDLPLCAYRGNDGCKCGIGHIVTDEELAMADANKAILYEKYLMESPVNMISVSALMEVLGFDHIRHYHFLIDIQTAHDYASKSRNPFMEEFESNMKNVSNRFNLRYNEL